MSSDILISEALDTPVNALDLESKKNLAAVREMDPERLSSSASHIGTVYGQKISTETDSGAAFVEDYLHPPGKRRPEYRGIPDGSVQAQSHPQWVTEDELSFASDSFPGTTINRVLILSPPSATRNRMVLAMDQSGGVFQSPAWNTSNKNISEASWNSEVESWRMEKCSDTYAYDVTSLNNAGFAYGVKFKGNVSLWALNGAQIDDGKHGDHTAFIKRFANHRGFDKVKGVLEQHRLAQAKPIGEPSPALACQVLSLGVLPTTGGDVLMKNSSGSESWRMTEGAFFVHHFTEPTQRFYSVSRSYTTVTTIPSASTNAAKYFCLYEYYDAATELWNLAQFSSPEGGNNMYDLAPWYDMEWTMLMINFGANVDLTGSINVAVVHKKCTGIGAQPPFGAFTSAFTAQGAHFDDKALRIAKTVPSGMKDMLPARANAFPALISKLAAFAPTVTNFLAKTFGTKDSPANMALHTLAQSLGEVVVPKVGKTTARRQQDKTLARAEGVTNRTAHRQIAAANLQRTQQIPRPVRQAQGAPRNRAAAPSVPSGRPKGMPRAEWALIQGQLG
jgi:hypothetical protein